MLTLSDAYSIVVSALPWYTKIEKTLFLLKSALQILIPNIQAYKKLFSIFEGQSSLLFCLRVLLMSRMSRSWISSHFDILTGPNKKQLLFAKRTR